MDASPPKPRAFRTLAITPLMGATSFYRAGMRYADTWYRQAPKLATLWFDAVEPGGDQVDSAVKLRDGLLQASEDSVNAANEELTRGIKDLRLFGAGTDAQ